MATMDEEEVVVTTQVIMNLERVTKEEEVEEAMVMAVDITGPITRDEKRIMMKITKIIDQEEVNFEEEEVI